MDIQVLKSELVKQIIATESEGLLNKLWETLQKNEQKDFWLELTTEQKEEVEIGLKQIENGETLDWDDFIKKVS